MSAWNGIYEEPERVCEDCNEPATRQTSDGVWLCEADYESLCDHYFADTYDEHAATPAEARSEQAEGEA